MSSLPALFTVLLFAMQEVAVEVTSLQSSSPEKGQLRLIEQQRVELTLQGKASSTEFAQLKSMAFADRPSQTSQSPIVLQLRDGSQMQPDQVSFAGQDVQLELGSGYTLKIPASHTQSVQFQKLSDKQLGQWRALQDSRLAGDTLAIIRSAESLDKIEGLISEITAEKVVFELGKQKIDAPRSKLAGVRFFGPSSPLLKTTAVVSDVRGNTWQAADLQYSGGRELDVTLVCGVKIKLPLSQMATIDFSIGSTLYVAELTPVSQLSSSGIKLKQPIAGTQTLLVPQPVQVPKSSGPSLKMLGSGQVVYRVPLEYKTLTGKVFLAPQGEQFTPCKVQIKLENELLWEAQLDHPSQAAEFSLAIQPDRRLQLNVQAVAKYPVGDVVVWQDLRMLK
jgi:hypothetical protein